VLTFIIFAAEKKVMESSADSECKSIFKDRNKKILEKNVLGDRAQVPSGLPKIRHAGHYHLPRPLDRNPGKFIISTLGTSFDPRGKL
jgi:hypothetical protein